MTNFAAKFITMKRLIFAIPAFMLFACGSQTTESNTEDSTNEETAVQQEAVNFYGDTITAEGAITLEELVAQMEGVDTLKTKVEGTINETCQMKGCWMTMDMADGSQMRVKFKDYGFFVPTDGAEGKLAVIEGMAFTDTVSVDHLKHLAEDEGKSEEEIAAISEPEIGLNFEAHGVIIRN